jgi:Protein of unknown function (DUF3224)
MRLLGGAGVAAALALWSFGTAAQTPGPPPPSRETSVTAHATGSFTVKLTPLAPDDKAEGSTMARMSIDKQFQGDIEGTSSGAMLSATTGVEGSAGYVAIERVTGTLRGRRGSFVLQHSGIMSRGTPRLVISLVPDSGTGELAGLSGTMALEIKDGKHLYDLEYSLPSVP